MVLQTEEEKITSSQIARQSSKFYFNLLYVTFTHRESELNPTFTSHLRFHIRHEYIQTQLAYKKLI